MPAPTMTISVSTASPSTSSVGCFSCLKGVTSTPPAVRAASAAVRMALLVTVAPATVSTVRLCSSTMRPGMALIAWSPMPGVSLFSPMVTAVMRPSS